VPLEDVADLLERWRRAGGVWSRSRVIAESATRLSRLSPDERRVLASALAEQGMPELVAPLRPDSPVRLEPHQLQTVVDGLLTLDGDDIDDLVATMRDPDQVRAHAYEALRELPPPPVPPPGHAVLDHLPPPGSSPPRRPEVPAADEIPRADEVTATDDDTATDDVMPTDVVAATDARHTALSPVAEGPTTGDTATIVEAAPAADRVPAAEDLPAAPAGVAADAATALVELRGATSPPARRRVLAGLRGRQLSVEEAVRLLDEVPDGWQRRRATLQLLDLGALDAVPGARVVDRLTRASDRRFAAGALLDAGLLAPGELPGLVPPSTARWLTARSRR
jgi:hypothetical protein